MARRMKHIDARLARWALWCESGGRVSVAPFARMRIAGSRPEGDAPLIHAEQVETDQLVRMLLFGEQALLVAIYRQRFELLELAVRRKARASGRPVERVARLLKQSVEAVRWQLCRIDRTLAAMIHARRRGEDPQTVLQPRSRRPGKRMRGEIGGRMRTLAAVAPDGN